MATTRAALAAIFLTLGPAAAPAADLTVLVDGLRSTSGDLVLCLWRNAKGFPNCAAGRDVTALSVPASQARSGVTFADVPAGTIAVSLLHDENADGKLATNFLGIPKEGIAVSNNAVPKRSAPKFKAAAFPFWETQAITLQVKYF